MFKKLRNFNGGQFALALLLTIAFMSNTGATWLYQEYTGEGENVVAEFDFTTPAKHYMQVTAATIGEIASTMRCDQIEYVMDASAENGGCMRVTKNLPLNHCMSADGYLVSSNYSTTTGINKLWVCDVNLVANLPTCTPN